MRLPWLLLLAAAHAAAADTAYMTQVSELLGIVEAPLYLRDACSRRVPEMRPALQASHAAWRARHAELLAAIEAQLRRADAHVVRQGARFTLADLRRAGAQAMDHRFDRLGHAEAREVCAGYDDFLREQDATMQGTVPQRLATLQATAD